MKGDINTLKWQMGILITAIVGGGGRNSECFRNTLCLIVWLVFSR